MCIFLSALYLIKGTTRNVKDIQKINYEEKEKRWQKTEAKENFVLSDWIGYFFHMRGHHLAIKLLLKFILILIPNSSRDSQQLTFGTCGLNSTALWIASTAFISAVLRPLLEAASGENLYKTKRREAWRLILASQRNIKGRTKSKGSLKSAEPVPLALIKPPWQKTSKQLNYRDIKNPSRSQKHVWNLS